MNKGRSRVRLAAVPLALAAAWLAPQAATAAAPSLPWVTISPLKGTPDASPSTQISFLGVPAADISRVVVRGARSGGHGGKLVGYATATGASFLPYRRFAVGEIVTVAAVETVKGAHRTIGTSFTIGSLYVAPPAPAPGATGPTGPTGTATKGTVVPAGATGPTGPAPGTVASFASQPALHPATIAVTSPAVDPALGDVFLTPVDGFVEPGAMIVNPAGQMIWFAPAPPGGQAADLQVQQYLGHTVLTYWQGRIAMGHGLGSGVIDDTTYKQIATVRAGNGLSMDLHDFQLAPNGVAWTTVYEPINANLTAYGGPANGILQDCVIQEIDVRTGLVMFEWHALGHIPLSASYVRPWHGSGSSWDWFHINSIDVEQNQNVLISSRNTWAVYQIGHTFGEVLWSLGGHSSSFALGPNVRFAWQHDATLLHDGSIQLFDNEDTPKVAGRSRGIDVALNFATHSATLSHEWIDPKQNVLSPSQGNVQQLPNADKLLGWGQIGLVSEISTANALTFQLSLPPLVESYRAFRFPWAAVPATPPALVASRPAAAAATSIAASWNGATAVLQWQVLAGATATALAPVGAPVASTGFETAISAATTAPYVAVRALGAGGAVLASSVAVAVAVS